MTFKIKTCKKLFSNFSEKQIEHFKSSIKKELVDPYPDDKHVKCFVEGTKDTYRLRIGSYRVFYKFDKEEKIVYIYEIMTAEQAHKKYGRLI